MNGLSGGKKNSENRDAEEVEGLTQQRSEKHKPGECRRPAVGDATNHGAHGVGLMYVQKREGVESQASPLREYKRCKMGNVSVFIRSPRYMNRKLPAELVQIMRYNGSPN